MSKMYSYLRRMLGVAETVGDISEVDMGEWLDKHDRIFIKGITAEGRSFEMVLEIGKEVQKDGD